ncbi:MAG: 4-(cytidine 5'-diphospho)-2-C-methyl-D-erythritol kinase [Alphaproteobacteria bacterium]|nr:4-(cytidine 5'-diphospho)-2-C-methyl-D-erythritol kinase [Alphaproteobacteria bacterium]
MGTRAVAGARTGRCAGDREEAGRRAARNGGQARGRRRRTGAGRRVNDAVRVAAPAKLNLYLHVTGRRASSEAAVSRNVGAPRDGTPSSATRGGYHTLDSLIAFAGLADRVIASPAPSGEITLTIDGPFVDAIATAGEDNLVLRAARALAAATGTKAGARLHLTKNIPVAAGLGGGSADAAATLRALTELWGVDAAPRLDEIALSLGADVPVCLASRPSLVTGIGEVVTPAPALPHAGLLLVNPGVAVATAAVFAAFDAASAAIPEGARDVRIPPVVFATAAALAAALAPARNDLTAAAQSLVPAIGEVLAALAAAEGCRLARMTGSGATCFGLFDDPGAAEAARRIVARGHPEWWAWAGGFAARG